MNYIGLQELKELGAVYVEELQIGQTGNSFHMLEGRKEEYYEFLNALVEKNGLDTSYGDFYYSRVEEHGREVLFMNCTMGEVRVLQELFFDAKNEPQENPFLLIQLEERVLKALLEISYNELLFSSFYFPKVGCTIWSNYNGRFLVFTKEEAVSRQVEALALQYGLQFEQ